MDKRFRLVIKNLATGKIFTKMFTVQEICQDEARQYLNKLNKHDLLSVDEDTGLKDIEDNPIFENDLLFSDQFVKPVVVTYCDRLGVWMDNTYTEELYKSIHKFDLKIVGNKFENEDLLK